MADGMMKTRTNRFMGWRPDLPDFRDFRYGSTIRAVERFDMGTAPLPDEAGARGVSSHPVFDQGPRGSCTGQATGLHVGLELKVTPRSAMFIYAEARKVIGELDRDDGAYIRDAIKVANVLGVPRDDLWPDIEANLHLDPADKADRDAAKRRVFNYYRLQNRVDYETCIASGHGFVIGVTVYGSFYNADHTGLVPYPSAGERPDGGHAIFVHRYHRRFASSPDGQRMAAQGLAVPERAYKFRNSWGAGWGLGGDAWIDARIVEDPYLSDDAWTVRKLAAA
jgi:hypothetical protein